MVDHFPLAITGTVAIGEDEVEISAIRAQGAGGQNVNKVSSAIHLRFDIAASSLPGEFKARLLALGDSRISSDGILIIKAQRFRTREKNLADALERLRDAVTAVSVTPKPRKRTRPSRAARRKRVEAKVKRGQKKQLRGKVRPD